MAFIKVSTSVAKSTPNRGPWDSDAEEVDVVSVLESKLWYWEIDMSSTLEKGLLSVWTTAFLAGGTFKREGMDGGRTRGG